MSTDTKAEVFIVESVRFDDERNGHTEGEIISKILALSGKQCEYYYIRTKRELVKVLEHFSDSRYRYLHISCHANSRSMETTLDPIQFDSLAKVLVPHLRNRRLFLSACSMASKYLADRIMPTSGCYSILGPAQDVGFNDAAILWASLYHVAFAADRNAIRRSVLMKKAQEVAELYRVPLHYFQRSLTGSRPYEFHQLGPDANA
jgi:hypothetical protein